MRGLKIITFQILIQFLISMSYRLILTLLLIVSVAELFAQNFDFNYNSSGRRVCLVTTASSVEDEGIVILFHDSLSNANDPIDVYRRPFGEASWDQVAFSLSPGTGRWLDTEPNVGETFEYKVKRTSTWTYASESYEAVGYTIGTRMQNYFAPKGSMILLVSDDVVSSLPEKFFRLKKEITADGWFIHELVVPRASNWDSGAEVVQIKQQISNLYASLPQEEKPKMLFIIGHVPLPRCGSTDVVAPDDHSQNTGARGCDGYYADLDGIYTDTATYNPGGLATPLAVNLPGDFKWDQDFFPSDLEMAFGRIDFADLTDLNTPEMELIERYFDRLSGYRNVEEGFEMGQKSGFYSGYDNSNDGSFRSLPNISGPENVYQNYAGGNHNQWVRENGPFAIYMQNRNVPEISDWVQFGMDATVYSSDQSYWGFGDVPQGSGAYSRIRALLGVESKCLIALWTTTGINIFHQVCTGISVGLAMKEIMNHNEVNQYLEKPPQQYDDERWWNRTHFAFYGDPSLQLYQVKPVEWINLEASGSNAILFWSRSSVQGAGYQVYESDNELGPFERITTNSLSDTSFVIPNYSVGNWYMVKVTQSHTAGCGEIVNTSMGISLQADIDVGIQGTSINKIIQIHPNPAQSIAHLEFSEISNYISILSADGKLIEAYKNLNSKKVSIPVDHLKSGVYFIQIGFIGGSNQVEKLIITK